MNDVTVTERINTMQDVYTELGISEADTKVTVGAALQEDLEAIQAFADLILSTRALNGKDNKHDWGNYNKEKHMPYFNMGGTDGSEFSLYYVRYDCTFSTVSSRLCFRDRALAKHSVSKFLPQYKALFL